MLQIDEDGRVSHAIFRVARLHRMLAGQLLRQAGLHPGQEMVMMRLWDRGPQRQSDLCGELGADSPTMTRTVQRLERAGFVRRSPDPTDGRAVLVEPTAASQALRHQVERMWRELEEATLGDMDEDQQAETLRVLGLLECNLAVRVNKPVGRPSGQA
ncbi:MarR family winged helix-turn-helix transcriptional regulator [Saccharothrix texasensis]|uniref:DNA-binding MarR family transcriptional regulator n=1 Tax=Saccharothrix texasensis TaxID=103734 RepID=A0A3N1HFU9_9PSEU|nr:MarR family winged helix-turn-helix transcriptional regulator [Saccharothrix texasensis]ROP41355.1 DNA-binding MarR family transcriptional regulator [Saccharothrix texasensis]